MNFESLSFDQKVKILSDNKIKKAIKDGEISEKEAKLFADRGVSDISNDDIAEIENSYLELESYIENNKKAERNERAKNMEKLVADESLATKKTAEDVEVPKTDDKTNVKADTQTPTTKTQFKGSVEPATIDGESSDSLKTKLRDEESSLKSIGNAITQAEKAQVEAENEYLEKLKEAAEKDKELQEL